MIAADLILTNGNLITLDDRAPSASAMAIHRGRIEAVGSDTEILALANPHTRRINLAGKVVIPGFHDCHIHLLWSGKLLTRQVDLVGCASIDEILLRLSDFAAKNDGWIQGHGFDQDKLCERRFPTRAELDRVNSNRPILITRICGHAAVVNSAAMATVSSEQRRAGEESIGLYTENAISPFFEHIPELSDEQLEAALLAIMQRGLRTGITSVQTMLDSPEQLQTFSRLRRELGKLPVRVVAMPPEKSADVLHQHGITTGFGDEWLRIGAVKFFSDGSLGARTALLASPYADDPTKIGERLYEPQVFKDRARAVQKMGFQIAIHAIGDQALRETIDAIEFALDGADNRMHRHRIEHASICPPDLLRRMAKLKIATTLQPQFVTSDTWTGNRVGSDRTHWCYPFRSMIDAGIPCGLSSDCPVEKFDAFECLYSAMNRHSWNPGNKLSIEQALKAYCLDSAYCAHREEEMGSLEAGKFADFVVASGNPLTTPPEKLRDLHAERVFVGGEEVFL
jgi:predicted amidohydrolase YtcJ